MYPRVYIVDNNLDDVDPKWREVCLILLQYPPSDLPSLKIYYRRALFDLVKNQFKQESDLIWMCRYYTFALFKLKNEVSVATETKEVIERLVANNENKNLTLIYMKY